MMFQVAEREGEDESVRGPREWEMGWKDTVIAYPDEITRIKAKFGTAGLYLWCCPILRHEDNGIMCRF